MFATYSDFHCSLIIAGKAGSLTIRKEFTKGYNLAGSSCLQIIFLLKNEKINGVYNELICKAFF